MENSSDTVLKTFWLDTLCYKLKDEKAIIC